MNMENTRISSAEQIAKHFLECAKKEGKSLTNMQLQKLVYFSHGYALAATEMPLIKDEVRAWNFGPVIPSLYETLKIFGSGPVQDNIFDRYDKMHLSSASQQYAIDFVWQTFKNHDAFTLSNISHLPGSPWDTVWNQDKFGTIPDSITKAYFKQFVTS